MGDTSACRLGGHECWRLDVPLRAAGSPEPSRDAPQLLVDEFGHLRLAVEALVGKRLHRGSAELQLGAGVVGACSTPEELAARIQAVASLLTGLHVGKDTLEKAGIDVEPGAGSLVALKAFAAHVGAEGCEAPIERLRALAGVRNLAPAHPAFDERVFLLTQFGVTVPIEDFGMAWFRIADGVRRALREVRLALQAVGGEDQTFADG